MNGTARPNTDETRNNDATRRQIVLAALPDIAFDGWSLQVLKQAAKKSGLSEAHVDALFPGGVNQAIITLARIADDAMIDTLEAEITDKSDLSIRGRIAKAIEARLNFLQKHKEAERQAVGRMARPTRTPHVTKSLWKTADRIWNWAGDQSEDYNHYTKRVLLSGVLAKTMLYWLQDDEPTFEQTKEFIRRQLDQVVKTSKMISKVKPGLDFLWRAGQSIKNLGPIKNLRPDRSPSGGSKPNQTRH